MSKPSRYGPVLRLVVLGLACAVLVALCTGALSQDHGQGHGHVEVTPDSIQWGPASPKLPPGAQMAVLHGNPSTPGELYVFRAKLPDGFSVPPHWHPMDEAVTVIQGTMVLGFGDRVDNAAMHELPAGSFVNLPKDKPHYNRMKGETILQFHGIGPYDIVYVNPDDDPSRLSRRD